MTGSGACVFTSESVTEGHPDKIADQISDSILDAVMAGDPNGRVACETLVTTGLAFIAGEITTTVYVDFPGLVRETIKQIGYTRAKFGFDYETCAVVSAIDPQSPDIAQGVDTGGAGDQGLMFGFACNETPELMPMPIMMAHKLTRRLTEARRTGDLEWLRPDGKSQVTVEYDGGTPKRIEAIVVSCQHSDTISIRELREDVERSHRPGDSAQDDRRSDQDLHQPHRPVRDRWAAGGLPGLTGRKIIVDTYGGVGSHGGGAFSGKDPSKVDRSASYMARHVAKNIVAAGTGEEGRGPARVRDRRGGPGVRDGGHLRYRHRARGGAHPIHPRGLPVDAEGDHHRPRSAEAHLQADRGLRPLRAHRAGVHVGADSPSGGAARRLQGLKLRSRCSGRGRVRTSSRRACMAWSGCCPLVPATRRTVLGNPASGVARSDWRPSRTWSVACIGSPDGRGAGVID